MGQSAATDFDQVKALLHQSGVAFTEESTGRLGIETGPADYLIELDPEQGLMCLFGVDMSELRLLVSGASNEDLGEDELQRVAREHLRPVCRLYQPIFAKAGFTEEVITDPDSYVVGFVKSINGLDPKTIVNWVRWCCWASQAPSA